ncbi:MAG: sigma 54-interacting transcriptional regulator [Candidatus Schekmanbacteria bacterium]|nr:sigma 54-interacting transcriptional regulator [Candidatus Schekmanbacteria bacterium]
MAGDFSGEMETSTAARHLAALRAILRRDLLTGSAWEAALGDFVEMTRAALAASEAFVSLWNGEAGSWTAYASGGALLNHRQIALRGSLSVIDRVRSSLSPVLSTADSPLELTSASLRLHDVGSVLAVPLFWWDVTAEQRGRQFAGCVYAHRTATVAPFAHEDVDLMVDITEIAQRNLNVLRYLQRVERDLDVSRERLRDLESASAARFALGDYESRDPWFIENVLRPLSRVSRSSRVGLLFLGPTGSGKSFLAQAYHYACVRGRGPFVVLDCSRVASAETLSAELFGYAPHSGYVNAPPRGRPGKARLADGGTLFIDEIGSMPADLQQHLLRLIETGRFSALGSSDEESADIQVIAATNEDLEGRVAAGTFREDLYWRISEVVIDLPPLSDRPADIPGLARRFLAAARERAGRSDIDALTDGAMTRLMQHDWSRSGNVRGLAQTINRAVLLAPPGARSLDDRHLQLQSLRRPEPSAPMQVVLPAGTQIAGRPGAAEAAANGGTVPPANAELELIKQAIRTHGYATAAAKSLGMTYHSLMWSLRRAGLSVRDVLAEGSRYD